MVEALRTSEEARRKLWLRLSAASEEAAGPGRPFGGGGGSSGGAAADLPEAAVWRRIAAWLLEAPAGTPDVVYLSMFWGSLGDDSWVARFLDRAMDVGLPRFLFVSPSEEYLADCEDIADRWRQGRFRRLLCVRSFAPFSRPYDVNNYAKFVFLPLLLALGVDYAWLDIDIFLARDPTERLLELSRGDGRGKQQPSATGVDVLTTDHFDETCLNHGVIFVRASDRTLIWALRYIRWMHVNPFGHDQNGWDACLHHSIENEPLVPGKPTNVSFAVLDTAYDFLTLTGWAGDAADLPRVQLLHLTRTTPIGVKEKRERFLALSEAVFGAADDGAREERGRKELLAQLLPLRTPVPSVKRPCYEGVHVAVEGPHVFCGVQSR
eukprot:TRINITY_DN2610_c0_g2_i2.p1 TRINITY_DN2610_c0_g2~~TRINITY_DN2610_c0_g2_i2.p1  ORF type:complete len:379 (+),score=84.16 TRINITY_DN2610_c0_g2_i2:3-1139(+)